MVAWRFDARTTAWLSALALVLALPGCVATRSYVDRVSHDAARSAMEGAAEGVSSLTAPLKKTLRETLLDSDTLPQVSQRVADATLQSVRAGLTAPETQRHVDELVARVMVALEREGSVATQKLIRSAEPELNEALRRAISGALVTLQDHLERDLTPRTRALAQANAEVLVSTLAAGLEVQLEHIRQAARDIGRELVSEAAVSMRDRKDFVGEVTQVAMLHAVRGARQGVWESFPERVPPRVMGAVAALGGLLLVSMGGLVVYWWRYRQSAKSLTIIAQQINEVEAQDLKQAIQRSTEANYVGPWLSNFLKARGL